MKTKTKPKRDDHNLGKLIVYVKLWAKGHLVKLWSVIDGETYLWDQLQDARDWAEKNDFDEGIWLEYPAGKTKKTKIKKGGRV